MFASNCVTSADGEGCGGKKPCATDIAASNGTAVATAGSLYWYTIEFGLIKVGNQVRAYGAGLLSSGGELAYCVEDPKPRRLPFELERIMRTEYIIDRYQENYFVIDSFDQLMRETAPDFTPLYQKLGS